MEIYKRYNTKKNKIIKDSQDPFNWLKIQTKFYNNILFNVFKIIYQQ